MRIYFNGTNANPLPNGSKFYTPIAEVDFSASFDMTEEDQKLFRDFNDFVKNFNDYICKEWENRVQNRQGEVSKEDIQTVEDFIDIEDSQ